MNEKLYDLGEIANFTGVPKHIVAYYIERWSIKPTAWVGGRRIFNEATIKEFKKMLEITIQAKSFKTKK